MYNLIIKSLSDFKLENGQELSKLLPLIEVQRLALFIFSNLPIPVERLIKEVDSILEVLPDTTDYINQEIRELRLLQVTNKSTKEQDVLLLFFMYYLYSIKHENSIVGYDMEQILEYFKSFSITNLSEEFNETSVKQAITISHQEKIYRRQENKLVPSLTTKEQFNQFLINKF